MSKALLAIKEAARACRRLGMRPAFYQDSVEQFEFCKDMFFEHPLMVRLQTDVLAFVYDDPGYGVEHAKKVGVEAAVILLMDGVGREPSELRRGALLAEMAGMLHDICRLENDHDQRAADLARTILADYPITEEDLAIVARAVSEHHRPSGIPYADWLEEAVSKAVHDADLFRLGLDFFASILWENIDYMDASEEEILEAFAQKAKAAAAAEPRFLTETGRRYGPELLALGRDLGRETYDRLCKQGASD